MLLDPSSSSKGAGLARLFIVFILQYVHCRHVNNNKRDTSEKDLMESKKPTLYHNLYMFYKQNQVLYNNTDSLTLILIKSVS